MRSDGFEEKLKPPGGMRLAWGIPFLAAAGGMTVATLNDPGPLWIPLSFLIVCAVVQWRFRQGWLFLLPALLPVADQVPYTGNMLVTGSDQLVLAVAFVGYGQALLGTRISPPFPGAARLSPAGGIILLLLFAAYAIGTVRGFLPYIPLDEQLAGYHSKWNTLRVAKGFFLPLLLLPLLVRSIREGGDKALVQLALGLLASLAAVAASSAFERLAYTGFFNFSSDYRITAPFWEMNVGGAALDGWLALTFPFALWAVLRSRRMALLLPSLALAGLAFYVGLVTFSRGVYGAYAASAIVWVLSGGTANRGATEADHAGKHGRFFGLLPSVALAALLLWGMWLVFHTGGYRTLAAIVVSIPAAHLAAVAGQASRPLSWIAAAFVWGILGGVELGLFLYMDKGAYWAFALATLAFVGCTLLWWRRPTQLAVGALLGGWMAMLTGAAMIALHWGGQSALDDCLRFEGVLAMVVFFQGVRREPLPAWHVRQSLTLLGIAGVLALLVAVSGGGYYIGSRFSTSQQDLGTREKHWHGALTWLNGSEDWILGKGIGRFPDAYYWNGPEGYTPGVYALPQEGGNRFLRLVSAKHPLSWGDVWRMLQPLPSDLAGPLTVSADVRVKQLVVLDFEVCYRQLIYAQDCSSAQVRLEPNAGQWKAVQVQLRGPKGDAGPWYAPRKLWFGLALESSAALADLDNLRLESGGVQLLRNGDFSSGGDFWFSSSDRDHLPWHIKSLFLNMLFDQGLLGLSAFLLLLLAVVVRMLAHADEWPMAPFFLASLAGFVAVGLFDSLVDVPRLAILYYLVCFTLLVVSPTGFEARRRVRRGRA